MSSRIINSLATVNATGVPTGLQFTFADTECYSMFAVSYSVVSGTVATMSLTLEATLDGTYWFAIGTPITGLTGGISLAPVQFPFLGIRANVTTLTGAAPILKVSLGAGRNFQA